MKNLDGNNAAAAALDDNEMSDVVGGMDAIPASKRCSNPNCSMYGKTKSYPKHSKVCKYCGQPTLEEKYSDYNKQGKKTL